MTLYEILTLVVSTLGITLIPVLFVMWRTVQRIQDQIQRDLLASLIRIELKLDRHLDWHLPPRP